MTLDEARKVTASWGRYPPAPIALRRIENALRGIFGGEPAEASGPPAQQAPLDEADLRAEVAMLNAGMM